MCAFRQISSVDEKDMAGSTSYPNASTSRGFKPYYWALSPDLGDTTSYRREGSSGGSLLKRCLLRVLPEIQQSEQNRRDRQVQVQVQESSSELALFSEDQTHHHMMAERRRRRRQKECILQLRDLVPGITKRDKITILENTIDYLRRIQLRKQTPEINDHTIERKMAELYHDWQSADSTSSSTAYACNSSNFHKVEVSELDVPAAERTVYSINIESSKSLQGAHTLIRLIACVESKPLQIFSLLFNFQNSKFYASILAQTQEGSILKPNIQEIKDDLDKEISLHATSSGFHEC